MIDIVKLEEDAFGYPAYMTQKIGRILSKKEIPFSITDLSCASLQEYMLSSNSKGLITFETSLTQRFPLHKLFGCKELCLTKNALDPIAHFFQDTHRKVALPDRKMIPHVSFFTPPLEKENFLPIHNKRPISIAAFLDLVDPEGLLQAWQHYFPADRVVVLKRWAHALQEQKERHPLQQMLAFPSDEIALFKNDSGHEIYSALTEWIHAKRTLAFIHSFPFPLHLFGNHRGQDWYKRLQKKDVYLHSLPPFTYALQLLEKCKIFIIDQLEAIDGPTEYFFPALEKGTLPLIPPTTFLIEQFGNDAPIFYRNPEELQERCAFFLKDERERKKWVEILREESSAFYPIEQVIELIQQSIL